MAKENDGVEGEVDVESNDTNESPSTNSNAEVVKWQGLAKRSETKLAKLEKELETLKGQRETTKQEDKPSQSPELDYGQKAFLKASGINGPDEIALVKEHLKLSGQSLDSVIDNPYFKQSLDSLRTTKANAAAADTGGGSTSVKKGSAQSYVDKGEEPPRDAPFELRKEYVKLMQEKNGSGRMFYNQ